MARKTYTAEQIIGMLREAEVRLAKGEKVGAICRGLSISEQSYYRWRREYGGLKVTQAARLKALEKENARLRKAVSNLTLDALILKGCCQSNRNQSPLRRQECNPSRTSDTGSALRSSGSLSGIITVSP